eukprot:6470426-Amphidinium_carterae.1
MGEGPSGSQQREVIPAKADTPAPATGVLRLNKDESKWRSSVLPHLQPAPVVLAIITSGVVCSWVAQ